MASPSGQQNQAQDDQVLQYVTFRLDDETYGIDVMQIQEVLRYTEIAPVPGAPDYVLGIINLRAMWSPLSTPAVVLAWRMRKSLTRHALW